VVTNIPVKISVNMEHDLKYDDDGRIKRTGNAICLLQKLSYNLKVNIFFISSIIHVI